MKLTTAVATQLSQISIFFSSNLNHSLAIKRLTLVNYYENLRRKPSNGLAARIILQ